MDREEVLLAVGEGRKGAGTNANAGIPDSTAHVLLLPLVGAALFFRLHQLVQMPPGIWPDEAAVGVGAMRSLATGNFEVVYTSNFGREGRFVWLQAFSVSMLGNTVAALRTPSAIIGTLTVLLSFFTTRRLLQFFRRDGHGKALDPNAVALLTSLFVGFSHWHVNFSQLAIRGILDPLFGLVSIYAMEALLERRTPRHAVAAGIVTGAGLYGYTSYRVIVARLLFLARSWR